MPRVALGVLPDAVSAPSRRGWSSSYAGTYAEGQVDVDDCPRRSNLYADGKYTPTVVFRRCPGESNKFELSKALTSNCFSEACGTTYAHVNFTAVPQKSHSNDDPDHAPMNKRLFFAELMFVLDVRAHEDTEPMRVLHVSTIDDVPCYGGCHEISRKINHTMRGVMDYERCHACHGILKHPKGDMFIGGHNSTRMPYYSAI
ncbi:hypothetical protein QYE76_037083 [Lolium multiflorum]|uniref:DUF3615 domain-containing protein n=1 Tax=Lolium multiflorum TaxID=4521 RepID=A0AAD8R236_LOLMU|nr:hypothetical protein QYE76_037083 [Lolium multiflorum]